MNLVEGVIRRYFEGLFTSTSPTESQIDAVVSSIPNRVTPEMNEMLMSPFSAKEL